MITIQLAKTEWCDDHLDQCWQTFDGRRTRCVEDFTTAKRALEDAGYYYAGHRSGVYTFQKRMSQPLTLPLDWHIAASLASHADEIDAGPDALDF